MNFFTKLWRETRRVFTDVGHVVLQPVAAIATGGLTIGLLTDAPAYAAFSPLLLDQVVMHKWLGINEIDAGGGEGLYIQLGVNYQDGLEVHAAAGVGSGDDFALDTNSFTISGNSGIYAVAGYDTRTHAYVAGGFQYGWFGGSGRYNLTSHEYSAQLGVGFPYGQDETLEKSSAGMFGAGISYSSSDGFSISAWAGINKGGMFVLPPWVPMLGSQDAKGTGMGYTYNLNSHEGKLQFNTPNPTKDFTKRISNGLTGMFRRSGEPASLIER